MLTGSKSTGGRPPQVGSNRSKENADHAVKFARLAAAYAIELGKGDIGYHATMSEPTCGYDQTWKLLAGLTSLAIAFALWYRTSRFV